MVEAELIAADAGIDLDTHDASKEMADGISGSGQQHSISSGQHEREGASDQESEFIVYHRLLRQHWHDQPAVDIEWRNLSYIVDVPCDDLSIPNLFKFFTGPFRTAAKAAGKYARLLHHYCDPHNESAAAAAADIKSKTAAVTRPLSALHNVSGRLQPQQMTLLMSPPGHGKSTLLKVLSQRTVHAQYIRRHLEDSDGAATATATATAAESYHAADSAITYNGLTAREVSERGWDLKKLTGYVYQSDHHMATLTVSETMAIAQSVAVAPVECLGSAALTALHARKVDLVINVLGLSTAAQTIAGNAMLRGVSGGEKKRLSIGEMLMLNTRALFLDETTTGLDSAVSYDITVALKQWVQATHSSVLACYLQPTPETFRQFDSLILMRHGEVVFQGPRTEVIAYFQDMDFHKPDYQDDADFLSDVLTTPEKYGAPRDLCCDGYCRGKQEHIFSSSSSSSSKFRYDLFTTAGLVERYKSSRYYSIYHSNDSIGKKLRNDSSSNSDNHNILKQQQQHEEAIIADDVAVCVPSPSSLHRQQSVAADENINTSYQPRTVLTQVTALDKMQLFSDTALSTATAAEVEAAAAISARGSGISSYTYRQYCKQYVFSLRYMFVLLFLRQYTVVVRNKFLWFPRWSTNIIMSLILGGLFYQTPAADYESRVGLILFAVVTCAFANMSELPVTDEAKPVFGKQIVDGHWYPALLYTSALTLMALPVALVSTFIVSTSIYWLTGFTHDVGRFFFFALIVYSVDLMCGAVFRFISYSVSNMFVAQQVDSPCVGISMIFGGFLITFNKLPVWLTFMYWLTPFSWSVRSIAVMEFSAARYNTLVLVPNSNPPVQERIGNLYLQGWGIQTDFSYTWCGFVYLFGLFALFTILGARKINSQRQETTIGTKRRFEIEQQEAEINAELAAVQQQQQQQVAAGVVTSGSDKSSMSKRAAEAARMTVTADLSLPFTKVSMVWQNISYVVPVLSADGVKSNKQLLTGISGFCSPGELTALMGSSGAGKTTLMDVLCGRKTEGTQSGDIYINGQLLRHPNSSSNSNSNSSNTAAINVATEFVQLVGYCEQTDLHMKFYTVYESLLFSASLRLPAAVTDAQRIVFVTEIMMLLELHNIAQQLVGTLAPGQLKLVTIGVELAANPSLLLLDEPTSGLDSRAALMVMQGIKRIAMTGRTVLCTIHQPSADVFFHFDRLLLLKTGGVTVYNGPLGFQGQAIVKYFEQQTLTAASASEATSAAAAATAEDYKLSPVSTFYSDDCQQQQQPLQLQDAFLMPKLPRNMNPASWMLDVVSANNTGLALQRATAAAATVESSTTNASKSSKINDSSKATLLDYSDIFATSALCAVTEAHVASLLQDGSSNNSSDSSNSSNSRELVKHSKYAASYTKQFSTVFARVWISYYRNIPFNGTRLMVLSILGTIYGLIFQSQFSLNSNNLQSIQAVIGGIFVAIAFGGVINSNTALPVIAAERPVFYREKSCSTYAPLTYSLSMALCEIPYIAIGSFCYVTPFYFLMGLPGSASSYFSYLLIQLLLGVTFNSVGHMLAAGMPNVLAASQVQGLFFTQSFLFGGVFIRGAILPAGWKWIYYMNPVPKAIYAVIAAQYDGSTAVITVPGSSPPQTVLLTDYIAHGIFDIAEHSYWIQVGWIVLTAAVLRAGAVLSIQYVSHVKR